MIQAQATATGGSKKRKHDARQRRATPEDGEVGMRVRTRRLEQGFSQTDLGNLIGVTFQQVQKYEKGANRIGAGRLQRIAEALKVPVTFFFKGKVVAGEESVFASMQSSGAVRIVKAFALIKSPKARQTLVDMAETLAKQDK